MDPDQLLDTSGLNCPFPVLKARKRLSAMAEGQVLRLITTDPLAALDVPAFCAESGHALVARENGEGRIVWTIRRA